jgi:hypothetical protein
MRPVKLYTVVKGTTARMNHWTCTGYRTLVPDSQTAQVILDGLANDALLYNDGGPPSVVNLMICQFKVVLGAEAKKQCIWVSALVP